MSCSVCKGVGRIPDPVTAVGLICSACGGTGERETYRLFQAYRFGFQDGMEAMRNALPFIEKAVGMDDLLQRLVENEREDDEEAQATLS